MPLTTGTRLGPHEIVAPVDGAIEAYRARDTRLDRPVVIQVLPPQWADDAAARERFERDAKTIAALNHPHIRALHDIGRERPRPAEASAGVGGEAAPDEVVAPADVSDAVFEPEIDFLVLEDLDGETIAERIARSSGASGSKRATTLRVDEVLAVATQIADALDKAHQKGLVHRALKPASVFLVKGGKASDPPVAKILDFGWTGDSSAKAEHYVLDPGPAKAGHYVPQAGDPGGRSARLQPGQGDVRPSVTSLPTMAPATVRGASLEPADLEYKAPEQIEGKDADARTDIFSFGVLLHEMLTGKKAFEGKSRAVLMAAIMTAEPDSLLASQPAASPALDHVLKRCLAKDPDDRWQTAHDLLVQLKWVVSLGVRPGAAAATGRWPGPILRIGLAAALVMGAAIAWPVTLYLRGPAEKEPFQYRTPVVGLNTGDISVSPDGQSIAFLARPDQGAPGSLFVRPVGGVASRRLAGTDDASQPFWSPDNRYIGFVAGGKLKTMEAIGGPAQEITPVDNFSGGAWNEAGTILFGSAKGLFSVSAEGGKPSPVTAIEKGETGHFWPRFLPDGRHYLYLAWSADTTGRAIYIGALDSKERTRLMAAESNVVYAPSTGSDGHLVFHREATVFAQPFDADTHAFTSDVAIQLAGGVAFNPANGRGNFDASSDALLYFQGSANVAGPTGRGQTGTTVQWGWVSRTGQLLGGAGEVGPYGDMDLSPDGKLIAATRQEPGTPGADIWVIDWERANVATQLTFDPADDINPVWSHDGSRIAFTTYRKGNADIYVKNANGVGDETPILDSANNESVEGWSADGRYVLYLQGQDNFQDIYALPTFGERKPIPLVQGKFQKNEPQLSYDGKWLAYTMEESGTFQVYVMSFPALDQKLKVSTNQGGGQPRWGKDGRVLYYRRLDNGIMAVEIKGGTKLEAGVPRFLFSPIVNNPFTRDSTRHQLAVSPDGERFLLRVPQGQVADAGRARAGRTATASLIFDPATGQVGGTFAGVGFGRGRANAGGAAGLTVLRNWKQVQSSKVKGQS